MLAPAIVVVGDSIYSTRIALHLVDSSIGTVRLKHRDPGDGAAGRIDVLANEKSNGLDEWTRESCLGRGWDGMPGRGTAWGQMRWMGTIGVSRRDLIGRHAGQSPVAGGPPGLSSHRGLWPRPSLSRLVESRAAAAVLSAPNCRLDAGVLA